jgi:hypothetical protein
VHCIISKSDTQAGNTQKFPGNTKYFTDTNFVVLPAQPRFFGERDVILFTLRTLQRNQQDSSLPQYPSLQILPERLFGKELESFFVEFSSNKKYALSRRLSQPHALNQKASALFTLI